MKIVVVADTHKEFYGYKDVVEKNQDADLFIHLGDGEYEFRDVANLYPTKNFLFVLGNCDFGDEPTERVVDANGYKILCVHGDLQNVANGLDPLITKAKDLDCKIALFGHTHVYRTELIDGVYVMNPGSIESPRDHNNPTYGVIEITDNGEITMNIIATK